jgi:hypothetical protein
MAGISSLAERLLASQEGRSSFHCHHLSFTHPYSELIEFHYISLHFIFKYVDSVLKPDKG